MPTGHFVQHTLPYPIYHIHAYGMRVLLMVLPLFSPLPPHLNTRLIMVMAEPIDKDSSIHNNQTMIAAQYLEISLSLSSSLSLSLSLSFLLFPFSSSASSFFFVCCVRWWPLDQGTFTKCFREDTETRQTGRQMEEDGRRDGLLFPPLPRLASTERREERTARHRRHR